MIYSSTARLGARIAAVVIVLLAIVDPALTVLRYDAAVIAVVHGPRAADSATAGDVRRVLDNVVRVVDAPFTSADAVVYVGRALVPPVEHSAAPLFVLENAPSVSVRSFPTSHDVFTAGRTPVDALVQGLPPGNAATALLRSAGVATDRVDAQGTADSTALVGLGIVPIEPGVQNLRIEVGARAGEPAIADLSTIARDGRWKALLYEPRPAWGSTFVRRVLEHDARFNVVSRTVTSRGISRDAGVSPARLVQAVALATYDVVVMSAPEALTSAELAGVEQFMRTRGGSVVVLLEQAPSAALDRLAGTSGAWHHRSLASTVPVHVRGTESSTVVSGGDFVWPSVLPPGAEVLAAVTLSAQKSSPARTIPAIWSVPVGGGRLFVSGATDTWKARAVTGTRFAQFWQGLVGQAASSALPALGVTLTPSAVRPGDAVRVRIEDRAVILGGGSAARSPISAQLVTEQGGAATALALRPSPRRGVLEGDFRAPANTGNYIVRVTGSGTTDSAALGVAPANRAPAGDDAALLRRLAASTGGETLSEREIASLPGRLARVMQRKARRAETHPMRSPWWMVPLALLLGFEWWSRRRSGLA
ncbi:MAG: hypothetical protein NTU67_09090 [Gemmatimonadetes bacterium]|nr:hypothetical protein [Gemmatimonadota bacterium]